MKTRVTIYAAALFLGPVLVAQGLRDPRLLSKSATSDWPTYHGDYSGQHHSPLTQINTSNVKGLSLAWIYHISSQPTGPQTALRPTANQGRGPAAGAPIDTAAAGRGRGGAGFFRGPQIKSIPLEVNGVLYFTTPGNAYAVDARTGQEIWRYPQSGSNGGGLGNRGLAMYSSWLYMEASNNLVSLDAKTGAERWSIPLAPENSPNVSSVAPIVIGNHVIAGVAGDVGRNRGWLEAHDAETGDLQWRWYSTPDPGQAGFDTWPSEQAVENGGSGPWEPPTYDPELNLLYVPTGNPTPTFDGRVRKGDNLFSDSVVALNVDTGKMVWYFQYTPHDTHDYDSAQVPVLFDGVIDGKPRKLLAQANRTGYFFVLDRTNGKALITKPYIPNLNWAKGLRPTGQPEGDPAKEPQVGGALVSPSSDGTANFEAPAFNPTTGLFYVNSTSSWSLFYASPDPGGAGHSEYTGFIQSKLRAIDYKTGDVKWEHDYPGGAFSVGTYPGLVSTAGNLVFAGDPVGNFIGFDAATGKILWHSQLSGEATNSPMTFEMDGHQYVTIAAGDSLYAFYLQ